MCASSNDRILFEKAIKRVNNFLRISGLKIISQEPESGNKWFCQRWFFYVTFSSVIYDLCSQIAWFTYAKIQGTFSLKEFTYLGPCFLFCILGNMKSYNFFKKSKLISELIYTLNILYTEVLSFEDTDRDLNNIYVKRRLKFLNITLNTLLSLNSLGIIAFSVGPILSSMFHYYKTGELSFLLPFLLLYPFDPYNIYFFPFVYIHQIWSAIISVFFIFGPDSFLYTSCVLVNVQYFYLKQEIETIFGYRSPLLNEMDSMEQKSKIAYIVRRHLQLLRCATLIERIYTESTLCNVLTSSLLICFTGFNVTAFGNYLAVVAPFFAFLTIVIGQIYLLCYYGNLLAESNAEISEAIYNCVWYRENVPIAKHMLFIAARAQKPCKITAYGFADIDMRAFAKIISSSWSYFAMLSSFHNNDSEK